MAKLISFFILVSTGAVLLIRGDVAKQAASAGVAESMQPLNSACPILLLASTLEKEELDQH